jgi:hypothetical protein
MLLLDEKKILEDSVSCPNMKFSQFIKYNNINIDKILVDKLFHNINNDMPIYMSESMIEYFGYSGNAAKQKLRLHELINTNFNSYENQLWYSYKNKEYTKYLKNLEAGQPDTKNSDEKSEINKLYPPAPTGRGTATKKHLLVHPKLFKEMLMLCQTDKGKQVRRYYIDMLDVMGLYVKYQNMSIIESKNFRISVLERLMIEESKKAYDERKKADDERKEQKERFDALMNRTANIQDTLEDTNETLHEVVKDRVELKQLDLSKHPKFIILRDPDDADMPFYVIRCQKESLQDAINKIKKDYPDLKRWLRIPQPNAVAFFNLIKIQLGQYMNRDGNWFGLKDITPREFKKKIKELNKTRITPPKKKRSD